MSDVWPWRIDALVARHRANDRFKSMNTVAAQTHRMTIMQLVDRIVAFRWAKDASRRYFRPAKGDSPATCGGKVRTRVVISWSIGRSGIRQNSFRTPGNSGEFHYSIIVGLFILFVREA